MGHDIAAHADTIQDCLDNLWTYFGTCETGAQDAHRVLRQAMPDAKFICIRRPPIEVCHSLAQHGIVDQEAEMYRRSLVLDEIEALGAFSIPYDSLKDARICSALWEYLLDGPFDFEWWRDMDEQMIDTDIASHMAYLASRQDAIMKLQAELAIPNHYHRVGWEPLESCYPEGQALMSAHLSESDSSEHHPLKMNVPLLTELEKQGLFRVMTARVDGRLVGYITWSLVPDAESEGIVIADQGAWYCEPDQPLGRKLLNQSFKELKAMGVQSVHLHHPENGRGAKLGALFKRLGAVPNQRRYSLWLDG